MTAEEILTQLDALFENGSAAGAVPFLKGHMQRALETGGTALYLSLSADLGGLLRNLGRMEESVRVLQDALSLMEQESLQETPQYGIMLVNAASSLRMAKEYSLASSCFSRAEHLLLTETGKSEDIAFFYNNRSLLFQDLGNLPAALDDLSCAQAYISRLPDEGFLIDKATTRTNLALLLMSVNRDDEALPLLESAVSLYKKGNACETPHYASLLSALGMHTFRKRKLREALTYYSCAADLTERLLGETVDYLLLQKNISLIRTLLQRETGPNPDSHPADPLPFPPPAVSGNTAKT